jgi:hypothetical protein
MRSSAATVAALLTAGTLIAPASTAMAAAKNQTHSSRHHTRQHAAAGAHCVHGCGLPANSGGMHAGTGPNLERPADRL